MKYPVRLVESGWHIRSNNHLVKSVPRNTPTDPVDPVDPPDELEQPQFYPMPELSYRQPALEPTPIDEMFIPPEFIGYNDSYAILIDEVTINDDHSKSLRNGPYNWIDGVGDDPNITLFPYFNEINCGSEGSVILRDLVNNGIITTGLNEYSALYEHQATVKTVTFIPAPGQETDYIADGGARIMEMNPEGSFTFLGDGVFSVIMRSEYGATPIDWRDDETTTEGHWEIPGRRIQTTRLKTINGKLEYTLKMLNTVFDDDADLVGNEYTVGNYTVRFTLMDSNQVQITLDYAGEVVDDILNTKVYIRLIPKCDKSLWVRPVHFTHMELGNLRTDYSLNERTTIYTDGQVRLDLDVATVASSSDDGSSTWKYSNYTAAINFTKSSIQSLITSRMQSVKDRAQEAWAEWYSTRTHIPEATYKPTNVGYIRLATWDNSVYYANHTKYSRKAPNGESWTWYELIGDGSVYYKMVDEATLVRDGKPSYDFIIAEPRQTLTSWFDNNLTGYCNGIIAGNIPLSTVPTGNVPTSIDFVSLSSYIYDETPRSINANFDIKVYALVAVAQGTVTSPSIGLSWNSIHGNIVVTKNGDAENPNV